MPDFVSKDGGLVRQVTAAYSATPHPFLSYAWIYRLLWGKGWSSWSVRSGEVYSGASGSPVEGRVVDPFEMGV
jgi:hypothetical protein